MTLEQNLGVFPLVIAEGASAKMRGMLGTAVFAGMIGVTFFGLFLTPVFYSVVRCLVERRRRFLRRPGRRLESEKPLRSPALIIPR